MQLCTGCSFAMNSSALRRWLEQAWYAESAPLLLRPFSHAFGLLVRLRQQAYRAGWLRRHSIEVPVIVVGNLVAGGAGKTPVVAALADRCREAGWRPGIVSRGYAASDNRRPQLVAPDADAAEVGDEPLLLARRTGLPVCIGRDRVAAVRRLLSTGVDLVLADDGLQHYRLARDLEVVVIDGCRRLGNGWLLPAGPLREPASRLPQADLVLVNGPAVGEAGFELVPAGWARLGDGQRRPPQAFAGQEALAIAGIGNPQRFYATLRSLGVTPRPIPVPDHGRVALGELAESTDLPLLMTEKDAVKYSSNNLYNAWYLIVNTKFNAIADRLISAALGQLPRPASASAGTRTE